MTKRSLDMENKENEPKSDPTTTNDPLPAKKPKLIAQTNDNEDENEVEHDSDREEDEEDVVEEEEEGPISISQVIELNEGTIHPKHKEYFTYEGTDLGMVSRTARFWSRKYLQALRHVNPDAYDVRLLLSTKTYVRFECLVRCTFIMILFVMVNWKSWKIALSI